jgi:hypothetical protein
MHPPLRDGHTQSVSPTSSDGKSQSAHALQVGQVFIPRQVLNAGIFVPDSLLACRAISDGAKLLWARLARYAGARGQCFPLLSTVAADLGRSERQVQRYLAELIHEQFVVAQQRGFNKSNTTGCCPAMVVLRTELKCRQLGIPLTHPTPTCCAARFLGFVPPIKVS